MYYRKKPLSESGFRINRLLLQQIIDYYGSYSLGDGLFFKVTWVGPSWPVPFLWQKGQGQNDIKNMIWQRP